MGWTLWNYVFLHLRVADVGAEINLLLDGGEGGGIGFNNKEAFPKPLGEWAYMDLLYALTKWR